VSLGVKQEGTGLHHAHDVGGAAGDCGRQAHNRNLELFAKEGEAQHPPRSAPWGHVLVSCRVRLFFLPFVARLVGFFAPLSRWWFEPCRVGPDNESLRIEALAFAKTEDEVKAESKVAGAAPSLEGNRPSSTKLARRLTPETLGLPVALYEHTAFAQERIWNIDSFDQNGASS
jgi:hypothetical protein